MRLRPGFSLIELLVAVVLADIGLLALVAGTAVVLAMFASVGLRERRTFADLADRDALDERLGEAATILPIDLRALSAADGDVRDARDTSIEIRQTIVSAIVCDTAPGALI